MDNFFDSENNNIKSLYDLDNEQLLLTMTALLTEYLFRYLKSRKDIKYEIVKLPAFLYVNEKTNETEAGTMRSVNINGFESAIDNLKKEYPNEKFYFYESYLSEGLFYIMFCHLPTYTHLTEEFL